MVDISLEQLILATICAGTTSTANKTVLTSNITSTASTKTINTSNHDILLHLSKLETNLKTISDEIAAFKKGLDDQIVVVMSGRVFKNIDDVEIWMKLNMTVNPVGGCCPFGVFVDPMNLMFRI